MYRASLVACLWLVGCGGGSDPDPDPDPDPTQDPITTSDPTIPTETLAADLEIGKISLYQGVESVLWSEGPPDTQQTPVIAERGGLLRVFVRPRDGFEARRIQGVLTVSNEGADDLVIEAATQISGASTDEDLDSTLNFDLEPEQISLSTELSIELHEANEDGPGGGVEADTTWDSSVALDSGLPTAASDDVTVVIIPIQYDADGTGRTPDTSQAHLDEIHDLMFSTYPAKSITIRVGDPLPWSSPISALNVFAFFNLLGAITDLRDQADEPPNTYYYGMFNPTDDFYDYCGDLGCVLGISNPGVNPANASLRASVGVGYPEHAASTLVHEVGHAHGRFHAPCGGAAGADPNYPHTDGVIGTWGYDLLNGVLKDPIENTDIMGYCSPQWVSNYTFYSLWERIDELRDQRRAAPRRVARLWIDGAGHTRIGGSVEVADPAGGTRVSVTLRNKDGAPAGAAPGWLYPSDHLPGGMVLLDRELPEGWTAEVHAP
ncbi:MAG TPA: hypothetical protein ENK18_14395 [Deltaproteobacteria bacterium]|nr:hypothetical protein [Deltaproteobacteria bacterium]